MHWDVKNINKKTKLKYKLVVDDNPGYMTLRPRCRSEALASDQQQGPKDMSHVNLKFRIFDINVIDVVN